MLGAVLSLAPFGLFQRLEPLITPTSKAQYFGECVALFLAWFVCPKVCSVKVCPEVISEAFKFGEIVALFLIHFSTSFLRFCRIVNGDYVYILSLNFYYYKHKKIFFLFSVLLVLFRSLVSFGFLSVGVALGLLLNYEKAKKRKRIAENRQKIPAFFYPTKQRENRTFSKKMNTE